MWKQKFFKDYDKAREFEREQSYKGCLTELTFVSGGYYVEWRAPRKI